MPTTQASRPTSARASSSSPSGDGDGFLAKLPGGSIEVPFELGLIADTAHGVRFDGGTGLKVDLPVAASLFGVFTVQFIALELKLASDPSLEIRGGFSLKLGPFQASVDQIGTALDLAAVANGIGDIGDLVKFLPPKGIGLALDIGPVKGGGYLYIDAEKGEYAGALELKIFAFSIKAIALITTKRPDGSEGWSLLIFVFGQFKVHVAFGIFWTGLGGMIGLHHRADLGALTAGMKTGALDDVLFPANPVADAPRIINRYKQLFPIEADSLLLGPMLELSFSEPPIVYVRLGLIFEVRNALGGDRPAELTKVILLGQLLVQLPPKELGVPAIVKLLVDVVGFYDAVEKFLLIRARLRDSFVGIEGFAKLDLSGELLLAMRFGDDPSFVLSAGGFHPAFKDVPRGRTAEPGAPGGRRSASAHSRSATRTTSPSRATASRAAARSRCPPTSTWRRSRGISPSTRCCTSRRSSTSSCSSSSRSRWRRSGRASRPSPCACRCKAPASGVPRATSASRSCGGTTTSTSTRAGEARRPSRPRRRARPRW